MFDTGRRPWIDVEGADADTVAAAVERCPSGALWYQRLDDAPGEQPSQPALCVPTDDGPLMLRGDLVVHDEAGEEIAAEPQLTLCRRGRSRSKPFCDGSHRQGFESTPERTVASEREGAESPGAFTPNSRVEPPASV